nr:hypothetical protein [Tanacetum cinerariifolium]
MRNSSFSHPNGLEKISAADIMCQRREAAPKPKASARKKKGDSASSTTPPTPTTTTTIESAPRLSATAKEKLPARAITPTEPAYVQRTEAGQLKIALKRSRQETDDERDEGSDDDSDETVKAGSGKDDDDNDDEDDDDNDEKEELAKNDEEDTETGKGGDEVRESEGSEEESNDEEDQELRLSEEARIQEKEEADELYRDVNINQGRGLQVTQNVKDSYVTLTLVNPDGLQESSSVSSFVTSMLNPTSDVGVESFSRRHLLRFEAPIPPPTIPSIILENLPTFNSAFRFEERLRSLETSFFEYRQTNPFVDAVSAIPGIIQQYMTQQMTNAVREAVQIQTDRLQDSLQRENDEFLRNIDENMKKIIKWQVKNHVKEQVSRILPRVEESVNATLEAERSDEQRNLYKALVEAYDVDKAILDTDGDSTILKLRREDDDQEGPSAGSNRGSKRQKEGGEHASASTPSETATEDYLSDGGTPTSGVSPDRAWNKTLPVAQGDAQSWISVLARQTDARSSFNKLLDTPIDLSNFIMNRLNVDTLTPDLLAGHTYELMRGLCNSLTELEYHLEEVYKATTDQLDWVNPKATDRLQQAHLWGVSHWGLKRQQFYGYAVNQESAIDVYSKRRIIAVTELKIVEWHDYKHLDWISVRRDDDQISKFKEGDLKRLGLQDIEDMLLLLEHCHQEASGRPSTGS